MIYNLGEHDPLTPCPEKVINGQTIPEEIGYVANETLSPILW